MYLITNKYLKQRSILFLNIKILRHCPFYGFVFTGMASLSITFKNILFTCTQIQKWCYDFFVVVALPFSVFKAVCKHTSILSNTSNDNTFDGFCVIKALHKNLSEQNGDCHKCTEIRELF